MERVNLYHEVHTVCPARTRDGQTPCRTSPSKALRSVRSSSPCWGDKVSRISSADR